MVTGDERWIRYITLLDTDLDQSEKNAKSEVARVSQTRANAEPKKDNAACFLRF